MNRHKHDGWRQAELFETKAWRSDMCGSCRVLRSWMSSGHLHQTGIGVDRAPLDIAGRQRLKATPHPAERHRRTDPIGVLSLVVGIVTHDQESVTIKATRSTVSPPRTAPGNSAQSTWVSKRPFLLFYAPAPLRRCCWISDKEQE